MDKEIEILARPKKCGQTREGGEGKKEQLLAGSLTTSCVLTTPLM